MAESKSSREHKTACSELLKECLRKLRLVHCVILLVQQGLRHESTPESANAADVLQAHVSHPLGIEIDRLSAMMAS